ncbi:MULTISPECIES: chorismate mutase [Methanobacterium]|uniref:Chorismate mutase n=1 Tax=Methanobacterium veterum TaxID=408577 RepID=A0A9E5DL30_9EURY|nr:MULTISPECIES: chorismate mutase [Methanobacterium]MCZ3366928.1 chorismate mutase [Methanobacterium veterum]MCZ3373925.1 chorismate mutase [Methanobacterium veterum]
MDRAEALKVLQESRVAIDKIDEELIYLIEKRTSLAKDIVSAKMALGMDIEDKKREDFIQDKIKKISKQKEIDGDFINKIMKILMELSKKEQEKILRRNTNG